MIRWRLFRLGLMDTARMECKLQVDGDSGVVGMRARRWYDDFRVPDDDITV